MLSNFVVLDHVHKKVGAVAQIVGPLPPPLPTIVVDDNNLPNKLAKSPFAAETLDNPTTWHKDCSYRIIHKKILAMAAAKHSNRHIHNQLTRSLVKSTTLPLFSRQLLLLLSDFSADDNDAGDDV